MTGVGLQRRSLGHSRMIVHRRYFSAACVPFGCMMNSPQSIPWAPAMLMKVGLLGGAGLIASLLALYWVEPDTSGGQALLAIVVFALVSGVGRLIWPSGS